MRRKATAVVLASFEGRALLMKITGPNGEAEGWMLPRWKKNRNLSWRLTMQAAFRRYFSIRLDHARFRPIKSVEVRGKMRHFFALDLSEDEAARLAKGEPSQYARTLLAPAERLGNPDTLDQEERDLLLALGD